MLEPTPKMHLIGILKTFLIYKRGQPDNFVLAYKRDQPDTKAFGHIDAGCLTSDVIMVMFFPSAVL